MAMAQSTIVFDTHAAIEELIATGVPEKQAAAHVRLHAQQINDHFATTGDMEKLGTSLRTDMQKLEASLRADMAKLEASLRADMEKLEASVRADMEKLRGDMEKLEASLRGDMEKLEASLRADMAKLETRLTKTITDTLKWIAGLQIGAITVIIAAIKLL